jgi:hypothetical protein
MILIMICLGILTLLFLMASTSLEDVPPPEDGDLSPARTYEEQRRLEEELLTNDPGDEVDGAVSPNLLDVSMDDLDSVEATRRPPPASSTSSTDPTATASATNPNGGAAEAVTTGKVANPNKGATEAAQRPPTTGAPTVDNMSARNDNRNTNDKTGEGGPVFLNPSEGQVNTPPP